VISWIVLLLDEGTDLGITFSLFKSAGEEDAGLDIGLAAIAMYELNFSVVFFFGILVSYLVLA
jgi:hypothetical protein